MKLIDKTTVKFILVGILNTVIGTTTMFLAYNIFHFSYWFSSAANYVVGSIVSFFLNKYFTFQNKEKSFKTILKFILNISICYLIAYGLAKPVVLKLSSNLSKSIRENVAMLVGMLLFIGLNYIGQKYLVFNLQKHTQKEITSRDETK